MKVHTSRLQKAKWNLTLPLSEARKNDEVISISDSQMLRWIDELNGIEDGDLTAKQIKNEIKAIKKLPDSIQNRRKIRNLYAKLDQTQYKADYICIVVDKLSDYRRACRGFLINGIKYVRLLATSGGLKNETVVFVSERLAPELRKRINCGRDESVPLVPAKLEAYRALTCSGSVPVSMPNGILVVNDCETEFYEDVISLNDESGVEPVMEFKCNEKIVLTESDGYGIMLPSLAERWSRELGLDYVASGVNTRFAWEKGMVFTFDFLEFADTVAHKHIVKDAWGNDVDITKVELILTTSMLKLWKCYDSLEAYLEQCAENHYTFGIAKTCPKELENERELNYQFIQSYHLNDAQIDELIRPTIDYFKDVLSGSYEKALLFLKGEYLNHKNADRGEDDFVKAMMIDRRIYDDPFVKRKIYQMIRKKINDAKIGVISVHGNYSVVSGDPYSLCQSVFGLPVTGLLKKNEIYSKYWADLQTDRVACFRAPMTAHANIRCPHIAVREDVLHWYRYMKTCTVFNSWDSMAHALNGMDKDGDLVFLTDNKVLVENHRDLPTVMCVQRSAKKKQVTEEDLIQSNIDGFGDDIGKTTNWITSMFEVQSQFEDENSDAYRTLDYRIMCGQLFQQNAIDRIKGIISKPMPKWWYNRSEIRTNEWIMDHERDFLYSVVADKKPYFMIYIYPELRSKYDAYIRDTWKKSMREFRQTVDELLEKEPEQLTTEEAEFLKYYHKCMPVGTHECVMNRICWKVEREFDNYFLKNVPDDGFDYRIMKTDKEYSATAYNAVSNLYVQYVKRLQEYMRVSKASRLDEDEITVGRSVMVRDFKMECQKACSNAQQLLNIILDLCYQRSGSKQFVWDICGTEIVENLLAINRNTIHFPAMDPNGNIDFCGKRFSMLSKEVIHND